MQQALSWRKLLGPEKQQDYFHQTIAYVEKRRALGVIVYPPKEQVFAAFKMTPFENVKVVILGQDPYHGPNQAHGMCFSVQDGVRHPPSLMNMFKELAQDLDGFQVPQSGNLAHWAKQGVLLLNTVLTVEAGKAHSHANLGWERFTDKVIAQLNQHREGIVFLLWGAHAQKKGKIIDRQRHHVLTAPHPSPLSAHRGFFGCKHFSRTNQLLQQQGQDPIDWRL